MYISGRERRILLRLLTAREEITVKDLAENLEVSERTIHRDLKKIEHTLADHQLRLIKKIGQGLQIEGKDENKEQLHSVITGEAATDFTPEERKAILLAILLESKEPIKLFALSHEIGVTNATVSSDLKQLEDELATYDLSIVRKKGIGIIIEGEEARKRSVLSHLISQNMNPIGLASQLKDHMEQNSKRRRSNQISDRLFGFVNPDVLEVIETRLDSAKNELPYELADSGYIGLVVHLALAIERIQKGDVIHFDKDHLRKIEGTTEYEISKKIIEALEVDLSIDIPKDEIGYIAMHLLGAKLRADRNNLMEDTSLNVALKANELIQSVSNHLNKEFADNKLLHDLTVHLRPAVFRLKQGMTIKNPMLREIKRDYLDFFYIVQKAVEETFPDMIFPEDEIGYLVLHFAASVLQEEEKLNLKALVICSSGIGTSNILATKLKQKVPEIRTVENKSLFDLPADVEEEYDLIISTVPLEELEGKYILASPMLTDTETRRIQKEIRKRTLVSKIKDRKDKRPNDTLQKLASIQNFSKTIMDLLNHFTVRNVSETDSIARVLNSICMELADNQIINSKEEVLTKLLNREKQGGLGIPNTQLSLYHTRSTYVLVPSFRIYSLSRPFTVRGMDGEWMEIQRVLLMLAPDRTDKEVLELLSYLSSLIIQGPQSIELFENEKTEKIKQFLSDHFYEFMKDKISI